MYFSQARHIVGVRAFVAKSRVVSDGTLPKRISHLKIVVLGSMCAVWARTVSGAHGETQMTRSPRDKVYISHPSSSPPRRKERSGTRPRTCLTRLRSAAVDSSDLTPLSMASCGTSEEL